MSDGVPVEQQSDDDDMQVLGLSYGDEAPEDHDED